MDWLATYDADIFFISKDKGLTAGIPAIYAHLQAQGWQVEENLSWCMDFLCSFSRPAV